MECRDPNSFGFRTGDNRSVPNLVRMIKTSENRTDCSVFRHKFVSEIETADHSNVRFSDVSTKLDHFIFKNFMINCIVKRSRLI